MFREKEFLGSHLKVPFSGACLSKGSFGTFYTYYGMPPFQNWVPAEPPSRIKMILHSKNTKIQYYRSKNQDVQRDFVN
jgi:hypothetical protein